MGINLSFFAFPLNLLLLILWLSMVVWLWEKRSTTAPVRFLLSKWGTLTALAALLSLSLVVGITGQRTWIQSWPALLIFLYFQTVLLLITLRGCVRRKSGEATGASTHSGFAQIRWRFLLNHLGVLIAVGSTFWGAPDSQNLRLQSFLNEPCSEAYTLNGEKIWLPYELKLTNFKSDTYQAELFIDQQPITLKVNHPYAHNIAEDIYLMSFGNEGNERQFCVLQIVRQPWKYGIVVGIIFILLGCLLLFLDGPKNPAECIKREGTDE